MNRFAIVNSVSGGEIHFSLSKFTTRNAAETRLKQLRNAGILYETHHWPDGQPLAVVEVHPIPTPGCVGNLVEVL